MAISVVVTNNGNSVYITVGERFDFRSHHEFRGGYRDEKPDAIYTIDLSKTNYIDSSALGMLLLLREFAGSDSANINITGCNESIKKIFFTTNFNRLFTIS